MERILIIDGTNIFIRNYAVVPSLSPHGYRTGGIYGTLTSLGYYANITNPDRIIMVWDGPGGSNKKRKLIPYYKEGRKPIRLNKNFDFEEEDAEDNKKYQQNRVVEYLDNLPIHQIRLEDIEADDVIAYLVKYYSDNQKIIASSDKDFYQLLGEKTIIYTPTKKIFLKAKDVCQEFQIHPNNFAVARSIIGDKSDNLHGVRGIGFKNAVKQFPFLSESKVVELEDIFKFCKESGKKYEKYILAEEVIKKNYEVMQLTDPLIGIVNIKNISRILQEKLSFSPTPFRAKLMEDGIHKIGESFIRDFKLLEIKNRDIDGN